jgi:signal transduction histidine kinase
MRTPTFIVLLVLISYVGSSQESIKGDTAYLQKLNSLAYSLYLMKPDSSILVAKEALELAIRGENKTEEARSYLSLSKAYWAKANFMLSTDNGFRALKIFENTSHSQYKILTWLSLARTLTELGNQIKAKEFIQLSIAQSSKIKDSLLIAEGYRELSFLFTEQKKADSAIYYADLGIELFKKYNQPVDLSILYGRKSRIYYDIGDFVKSKEFAYKGIPIDSLTGNRRALSVSKFLAAQSEREFGNHKTAIQLVKSSIQISEEINNPQWLIRGHELLAKLYKEEGDLLKANRELELVSVYKDNLFDIEKSGQAHEMQALYELENKQKTILLLENENKLKKQQFTNQRLIVAILVIGIILLLATIFFLIRLRRIQTKANLKLSKQKEKIQKQAEDLEQLNQLKTKLFSVISHDLRGPIASLRTLLEMLSNKFMTPDEFLIHSEKLKHNIDGTQQTLENLLNWCLTQMEGIRTSPEKVSLSNAVNEVCQVLSDAAIAKGIFIEKQFSDHAEAIVDPNQLQVILRNLIHNAIKFSGANTTVITSVEPNGDFWKITLRDTGMGMTQEEINTILNTSHYFSKYGTQQEKGTGLGLMLCKEFIKLNKGVLKITSEPNKGTSISVLLPKA